MKNDKEDTAEKTIKFNIFDVLKIGRAEIRHSNMLAWLFDPKGNHGLGVKVLSGLLKLIDKNENELNFDKLNLFSFEVYREKYHIDILLVSHENNVVICIENKIDACEHGNQLTEYKNFVKTNYKDYHKFYVYLSPFGRKASDDDWISVSYGKIVDIIESVYTNCDNVTSDVNVLITHYIELIKGDIISNLECIREKLLDWLKENKSIINENSVTPVVERNYIRFKTKYLSELFCDSGDKESGWDKNFYYYELWKNHEDCILFLTFNNNVYTLERVVNKFLPK